MNSKIVSYLTSSYEHASVIIKKKAHLLAIMDTVLLALVFPIPPIVFLIRGDIQRPLVIATPIILGVGLSLIALRRGYYGFAANTTAISAALCIAIGSAYQNYGNPTIGFSSMIYMVSAVIAFSALFCSRAWTTGIAATLIAGDIGYYLFLMSRGEIDPAVLKTGLFDSFLTFIFVYAVGILVIKVSRDSLNEVKLESEKNRAQYLKIRDLLESVTGISSELAESSGKMSDMTVRFSDSSQNQAAAIEEITSAVEEVNAGMDLVNGNVEQQFASVGILMQKIAELSSAVDSMKGKMNEASVISEQTSRESQTGEETLETMNGTMAAISESARQMTTIVDVINRIADQIRLLSLNAAIEAARAGDAGRGFAVVADEISKLSDQTGESVKEIFQLINSTDSGVSLAMANVQDTVTLMRTTIGNINAITAKMYDINLAMRTQVAANLIVEEQSGNVREHSEQIKLSTNEQLIALSEVAKSISDINQLTQSVASGSMELSGEAERVMRAADTLRSKIALFHE